MEGDNAIDKAIPTLEKFMLAKSRSLTQSTLENLKRSSGFHHFSCPNQDAENARRILHDEIDKSLDELLAESREPNPAACL